MTAGPTREPLDPVRFLGNRSSGRMGYAIAAAAWRRGADVLLITGPTEVAVPPGLEDVRRVETAAEMGEALQASVADADALFMVAAIADFRPASVATDKLRRGDGPPALELEAVPDLMAEAGSASDERLRVAFAVELGGDAGIDRARRKLKDKRADLIVVNDPTEEGSAFGGETNRVTVIHASGDVEKLPRMLKTEVADEVLDRVERLLPGD